MQNTFLTIELLTCSLYVSEISHKEKSDKERDNIFVVDVDKYETLNRTGVDSRATNSACHEIAAEINNSSLVERKEPASGPCSGAILLAKLNPGRWRRGLKPDELFGRVMNVSGRSTYFSAGRSEE